MKTELKPSLLRATWIAGRRQITTFVRYPSWLIAMCVWPVLFPFGYIFSSRALAGPDGAALITFAELAGTTNYAAFIAIGTTFWMWFNGMLWGLGSSLRAEQMRGTLESNWLAPVPKIFLLLGSFWADALMGFVVLAISSVTIYLVYGVRVMGSMLHLLLVVLASIPSIYGIGIIFASLVLVAKETNSFIFFVRGIMTVFCGVTYPIAVLPTWMRTISRALPLTHAIQAVRAIVAGQPISTLRSELTFLVVSGVIILSVGYATFKWVEQRLLISGTIGQY